MTSSANASSSPPAALRISSFSELGPPVTPRLYRLLGGQPLQVRPPRTCRLLLVELERAGVDAVALPGAAGTVGEHVTQMSAARRAGHLDPVHSEAVVVMQLDVGPVRRLGEARPAGARFELGLGGEQLGSAARA